ncbi:MAG: hypothetical protein K0S80_2341 [Neobacillus sp.]|nr:hypothetical protein [Neobacillus sp.]
MGESDQDRLVGIKEIIAAIKSACPGTKTITLDTADANWLIRQVEQNKELEAYFEAMEQTSHKWMKRWQELESKNNDSQKEITKLKSMRRIGKYLKVEAENLQLSRENKCLTDRLEKGCGCEKSCKTPSN